ncbi:MAG: type II toxin-antitoxin system VapC family toxin [Treponema sp.]|jgi:PIN domain nuclease of toxin-antitoxin system|nr:type II toxin-antitoxin system VapC family toxin [Treponema sp.]
MRHLLDTHAVIWFFNGDNSISETAKQAILDLSNKKYISMISAWELAIKIGLGKLDFDGKAAGFINIAENSGFTILPIKTSHLTVFETLPLIHRDPFDRLLVATALAEQMTIISADGNISRYDVLHIW